MPVSRRRTNRRRVKRTKRTKRTRRTRPRRKTNRKTSRRRMKRKFNASSIDDLSDLFSQMARGTGTTVARAAAAAATISSNSVDDLLGALERVRVTPESTALKDAIISRFHRGEGGSLRPTRRVDYSKLEGEGDSEEEYMGASATHIPKKPKIDRKKILEDRRKMVAGLSKDIMKLDRENLRTLKLCDLQRIAKAYKNSDNFKLRIIAKEVLIGSTSVKSSGKRALETKLYEVRCKYNAIIRPFEPGYYNPRRSSGQLFELEKEMQKRRTEQRRAVGSQFRIPEPTLYRPGQNLISSRTPLPMSQSQRLRWELERKRMREAKKQKGNKRRFRTHNVI